MNKYTERFKNKEDFVLLEIIQNPTECDPLAVEAATIELKSRNLTEKEFKDARNIIESRNSKFEKASQGFEKTVKIARPISKALRILRFLSN
jgi:hypothetical protein